MKKTTKTTKAPAPATKETAPTPAAKINAPTPTPKAAAPQPAPKAPAPAAEPKVAAPAAARKAAVAPKIKPPAEPAVAAPAVVTKPKASSVTIVASIDVGFGNTLTIRGDAPALSWDKGLTLSNTASDRWEIVLPGVDRPVRFKFLVNDLTWSAGEDYTVSPGDTLTLTPTF